ncbi:UNVERIFIED_CONTAM: hypothetical protein Sangu_2869700 [Sesamum angustifolium]|uniref:Retrotransposon gag domain-containing protein n=1 Tax=Sesamum angustifolium TaxID=2727405 RepID=A0AAW2IP32_9LAMI
MEARLHWVEELVGKPEQPPTVGLIQQVLAVEEAVENLKRRQGYRIRRRCPLKAYISIGMLGCDGVLVCRMTPAVNRERIETWEVLKKELKDQFIPFNKSWVAREFLRNLRYTGTVPEFVKEFSSFMLDVTDMLEEDKLFNFMAGLKPWAQTKLRRQGVKDLPSTIGAADRSADFKVANDPE